MVEDEGRRDLARDRFVTADPEEAEERIRTSYQVTGGVRMSRDVNGFTFSQHVQASLGFAVTRFQCSIEVGYHGPLGGLLCVEQVHGGRLLIETAHYELRTCAGDVCLIPPHEPWWATTQEVDLAPLILDPAAVATYAEATCGIERDSLRFTGIAAISPAMEQHWNATVAYIRDHVLDNPFASDSPVVLTGAFRLLASSMLSTFPNTALGVITDPDGPGVRDVPTSVLREVLDYLDTHADQPIGPPEIAELTGMPASHITAGLHRHGQDPARRLWHARLLGVHRALLDTDPTAGISVAEIATRWGFTSIGRFGVVYRHVFGEVPEATLHR